jgi:hypothetical protein
MNDRKLKHEMKDDKIKSPSHYTQGSIECIDAIRAALTQEEFRGYVKGNVIKYAWRERFKNGDEDLKKIIRYIEILLEGKK